MDGRSCVGLKIATNIEWDLDTREEELVCTSNANFFCVKSFVIEEE